MPLNRINLSQQAYEALKAMILDRRFPPGSRINVEHVAKELGVSRTPVWEAVMHLTREGLVTNYPHRGVYVISRSAKEIRDLYAVREVTEALAARLAAKLISAEALERMAANLNEQYEALSRNDPNTYSALDAVFHGIIYEYCGNHPLQEVLRSIRDKMWPLRVPFAPLMARLYQDHRDLLDALRAAEPDRAEAICRRHVQCIMAVIGDESDPIDPTHEGSSPNP